LGKAHRLTALLMPPAGNRRRHEKAVSDVCAQCAGAAFVAERGKRGLFSVEDRCSVDFFRI
ncbi:hypothetical protein, partial [Nitrobacter winogradskyi]|uniref:hypothetical protein n=1 Tax=Nitrobacter winogradskyi TaxID=913 RepID=UPI001AEEC0EB